MTTRPRYKTNPASAYDILRKGKLTFDQMTGLWCHETDIIIQRGIKRDSRNRGSWDRYYGRGQDR